ncbi:MAG: serine/threonine-protein phosphatase [Ruminococcaceae bacterium]|nr:serine/threonine-protein phosphatase [Oscillospiraceae bacterium]
MDFIVSATTDIGIVKDTNQDGLSVKVINTPQGKMTFAILCDGMGGLAKGEVASTTVIAAFNDWVHQQLPVLCKAPIEDSVIRSQWENIVVSQNNIIKAYGARQGIRLGTTIVVMLLTQTRYYILNIGDSRAYEISDTLHQLTVDQTFVANEIRMGRMTPEQAKVDPRRNVLLQCVGASEDVYPDMFFGDVKKDAVYMMCSDGFRHEITPDEIYEKFHPNVLISADAMDNSARQLIELNKQRAERDNISVLLIRTY